MLSQRNNLFRRIVLITGIILVLSACDDRPKGVLSQSKMASVLTDIHKLDGCLIEKGYQYGHFKDKSPYYKFILQKYGITEAVFDSSLVWYTKNPKKFEDVYTKVIDNLTREDKEIKKGKYHPVDSTELAMIKYNIWNKGTKYHFTKDSTRTRFDFEIADNNFLFGDVYILRFLQRIAPEDSCTGQRVVFRINYTNGKSDSISYKAYNDSLLRRYTFHFAARKKIKIKSISGQLLGSKVYKGKFNATLDSISLIRKFNGVKQDSLRKVVEKADSALKHKAPKADPAIDMRRQKQFLHLK